MITKSDGNQIMLRMYCLHWLYNQPWSRSCKIEDFFGRECDRAWLEDFSSRPTYICLALGLLERWAGPWDITASRSRRRMSSHTPQDEFLWPENISLDCDPARIEDFSGYYCDLVHDKKISLAIELYLFGLQAARSVGRTLGHYSIAITPVHVLQHAESVV